MYNAPFEMGNEIIMNTISKYGKVEGMRLNKYTKGPAAGLLNGTRTFKEDFPAIQLSGEIHSSRAGVKEREESVTVSQVPATTRYGVEREKVPAQTISQNAIDPKGTTHPDCSENAVQETSTTCEAEIHTERNNVDQPIGKISCENMEYDKADDMEPTNMTGTECEVARGGNMDRMEEIVEVTCIKPPNKNKNDTYKKDQNKPGKNELEINGSDDENQAGCQGPGHGNWEKKSKPQRVEVNQSAVGAGHDDAQNSAKSLILICSVLLSKPFLNPLTRSSFSSSLLLTHLSTPLPASLPSTIRATPPPSSRGHKTRISPPAVPFKTLLTSFLPRRLLIGSPT
ncbi:hypothetical protein Hamer_G013080 [Homarus americanus]|uniref:Uncharacterized protein n=1 Tax=Homarus americanus TaxID=6706 RepID=A0A8J5JXD9_HOMAM|nr:hypothetical protein Hamer_G013080 [Homarus americanus]